MVKEREAEAKEIQPETEAPELISTRIDRLLEELDQRSERYRKIDTENTDNIENTSDDKQEAISGSVERSIFFEKNVEKKVAGWLQGIFDTAAKNLREGKPGRMEKAGWIVDPKWQQAARQLEAGVDENLAKMERVISHLNDEGLTDKQKDELSFAARYLKGVAEMESVLAESFGTNFQGKDTAGVEAYSDYMDNLTFEADVPNAGHIKFGEGVGVHYGQPVVDRWLRQHKVVALKEAPDSKDFITIQTMDDNTVYCRSSEGSPMKYDRKKFFNETFRNSYVFSGDKSTGEVKADLGNEAIEKPITPDIPVENIAQQVEKVAAETENTDQASPDGLIETVNLDQSADIQNIEPPIATEDEKAPHVFTFDDFDKRPRAPEIDAAKLAEKKDTHVFSLDDFNNQPRMVNQEVIKPAEKSDAHVFSLDDFNNQPRMANPEVTKPVEDNDAHVFSLDDFNNDKNSTAISEAKADTESQLHGRVQKEAHNVNGPDDILAEVKDMRISDAKAEIAAAKGEQALAQATPVESVDAPNNAGLTSSAPETTANISSGVDYSSDSGGSDYTPEVVKPQGIEQSNIQQANVSENNIASTNAAESEASLGINESVDNVDQVTQASIPEVALPDSGIVDVPKPEANGLGDEVGTDTDEEDIAPEQVAETIENDPTAMKNVKERANDVLADLGNFIKVRSIMGIERASYMDGSDAGALYRDIKELRRALAGAEPNSAVIKTTLEKISQDFLLPSSKKLESPDDRALQLSNLKLLKTTIGKLGSTFGETDRLPFQKFDAKINDLTKNFSSDGENIAATSNPSVN